MREPNMIGIVEVRVCETRVTLTWTHLDSPAGLQARAIGCMR